MNLTELRKKEAIINEKYKNSDDLSAYIKEIDALYEQLDESEFKKYTPIRVLLEKTNASVERLAQRSGVSIEKIKQSFDKPNDDLTLLDARKLGIGFKRIGLCVDEFDILGDERCEKLYVEYRQRQKQGEQTKEDIEYTSLQDTAIVGAILTQKRVSKGILRKDLAIQSNVSLSSLEKYESGEKDFTKAAVGTAYTIAKILECRMEDLIGEEYLNGEDNKC